MIDEPQATFLEQLADWKVILVVLLATMAFELFIYTGRTNELRSDSRLANPVLDARFSYTPDQAYSIMRDLQSEGRRLYVVTTASEDMIFPLLYNLLLGLALIATFRAAFSPSLQTLSGKPATLTSSGEKAEARFKNVARFPLLLLFCDYAENLCLIVLMLSYPVRLNWLARLASLFTSLKWILLAICLILILFGLAIWGGRKLGFKT